MALIVSLNCMVAVTKMASVADSDFPLERKSLTYMGAQKCFCGSIKSTRKNNYLVTVYTPGCPETHPGAATH